MTRASVTRQDWERWVRFVQDPIGFDHDAARLAVLREDVQLFENEALEALGGLSEATGHHLDGLREAEF
jgi:hypothetical protein